MAQDEPNPPAVNFAWLEKISPVVHRHGWRTLHMHKLKVDQRAHIAALVERMDLDRVPYHGHVVDMGCGFGAVDDYLGVLRPDLCFTLINRVQSQIDLCPGDRVRYAVRNVDAHATQLPSGASDLTLFTCALVNMDPLYALREAVRITRPNGIVFLYEPLRAPDVDPEPLERELQARVLTQDELFKVVKQAGLRLAECECPSLYYDDAFRALLAVDGKERLLSGLYPIVLRCLR